MAAVNDDRQPLVMRAGGKTRVITPTRQRSLACATLLLAECLERIACYSFVGNLMFFLTKSPLCWDISLASSAVLVFNGVMWVTGLLAGLVSDAFLGRFYTIIIGYVIYVIGYVYLPYLSFYTDKHSNPGNNPEVDPSGHSATACDSQQFMNSLPWFCSHLTSCTCDISMFAFLVIIALGAGIVRTNLAPFGGDQVSY